MAITSKTTSKTRRPVIVRIPASSETESLSIKEAETILRRAGGEPMSKEEAAHFQKYQKYQKV